MKVRHIGGRFSIGDLSPGQFAYLTALVGASGALVDSEGGFNGDPVVPEARELYGPLKVETIARDLTGLVETVELSQELWRRSQLEERLAS